MGKFAKGWGFEAYPVVWLLVSGLLVRSAIAVWIPPGFDEAYYYLYTQHPDWSYFDHPLMVGISTGLGPWLTGQVSQFTIRIGSLLLYTGALILLYLTSVQLFSQRAAVLTVAIASLVPIFFVGFGVLTLPDSPLIFFWSATLLIAAKEFLRQPTYYPSWRLAAIGLLVGLACLSKYHGVVLGLGLVGFCFTSRQHRTVFKSPWMLAALGLFCLTVSPIIIWNFQHEWVSLRYQSGRAVPNRGYSLLELIGTILIGIGYLFPAFGFPLWWVSLKTAWEQWRNPNHFVARTPHSSLATLLILWISLPIILSFTFMGGYRPILPTWAMPGFWGMTLLLGDRAAKWSLREVRRWLGMSALIIGMLIAIALPHLTLGILQKPSAYAVLGGFIPATTDGSVQLVDIQQVRRGFKESDNLTRALEQADFVFADDIFIAGYVGMALASLAHPPIVCFNDDLRGFAFWSTAEEWVGKDGLYIAPKRHLNSTKYAGYFQSFEQIGEIPIWRGGVIVDVFQVYQSKNLLKPYPRLYGTGNGKASVLRGDG
ncbi:glycosyltransferase family 39 protein [Phormidium sp. CLA17]|uniref:ArnT family glycosyltransferase n=1 Tax=Leptolyngbya sp. Cla-17 TaxID=2803751 RepID=UPI001491A5FA|nr:glycosyltransferase family 39 protein [Leptolyngbya sp. Cla-17]MBM0743498.1 glycosyltransferase family 39 protein [Leptolyngbya sp. Cla-17]